jgi:hypothetical protein
MLSQFQNEPERVGRGLAALGICFRSFAEAVYIIGQDSRRRFLGETLSFILTFFLMLAHV